MYQINASVQHRDTVSLLCMDLISDCCKTSHETRIGSRIDSEHVRVSLSISCRRHGLSVVLDDMFGWKATRGMLDDLVNSVGRIGMSLHSNIEYFAVLCDLSERRLALSGENLECIADALNGYERFSSCVSKDDNIFAVALGLQQGASSKSSNDWKGIARA